MIHSLRESERPRERCLSKGVSSLTLRECLALLIHSGPPGVGSLGLAAELLAKPGEGLDEAEEERAFFNTMEISGPALLESVSGLGSAGRARLLAAFELGRRYSVSLEEKRNPVRLVVRAPHPALHATRKVPGFLRQEAREWLGFVPWFKSGKVGGFCLVERGVRTHVNVDPIELFARILALRPSGFFLFHNHPSGDLNPSEPDHDLTRRVDALSRSLGVRLLGHAIITARSEKWIGMI